MNGCARPSWWCGAAVASCLGAGTVDARAQDPHGDSALVPIRVEVSAAPGCADSETFTRQVLERTSKARLAVPGESARSFRVSVLRDGEGSRGTVRLEAAGQVVADRVVEGATCSEVVSGLALVVALTIDPEARASSSEATPATRPATDRPAPSARAGTSPAPGPRTPAPPRPRPPPPSRPPSRVEWGAGVGSMVVRGIAPAWVLATQAHAEIAVGEPALWAPSVRLGVARGSTSFEHRLAPVFFSWTVARAEGCPLRLAPWRVLSARACARFEAGTLVAQAERRTDLTPHTRSRPWVDVGALLRLRLVLLGPLSVEVEGGFVRPLARYRFSFRELSEPSPVSVYSTPPAAAFAAAGLAARFR